MQGQDGTKKVTRQAVLYFSFAAFVYALNLLIQYLHFTFLAPSICASISWNFVQSYYCPNDGRVLVGSVLGVGVSYIVKFILDKFIVFEKKSTDLKQTSREFIKYFLFAIFTTIINIGGQYILYKIFLWEYLVAAILPLAAGYIIKFLLDRKYVFPPAEENFGKTLGKEQPEIGALDKIRKILAVSTRIKMDTMQRALGLDTDTFSKKIFDWATEFKFKIEGDSIVVENGDVTGFISKLDAEFVNWESKTEKKG